MDPNATLKGLRDAIQEARGHRAREGERAELDRLREASNYVEALDDWLSKGGFLPTAWDPPSRRHAISDQYGRR